MFHTRYGVSEESIYDNTDHGDESASEEQPLPAEDPDAEYELPNIAEAHSVPTSRQLSEEEELYAAPTLANR